MNQFIYLQVKKMTRSSFWQKNLVLNIVICIFMLLVLLELLGVGIFLESILQKAGHGNSPLQILNKGLAYYFLVVFMIRFFIQDLPVMEITPLLVLPVKRMKISLFLNYRSLLSFFNFLPFFLFLPFTLTYLSVHYSPQTAFVWFAAIFLYELTANFIVIRIKREATVKPVIMLLFFVVVLFIGAMEKFHVFSFSQISAWYFGRLLHQPLWILLPVVTLTLTFYESFRYIKKHSYLDDISRKKKRTEHLSSRFEGLENRGKIGAMILKEVRLLLRNKRSKQMVFFILPLGLLYGLMFYPAKQTLNNMMLLAFVGIFITGVFLITYGQYILAWESRHFDFILTSPVTAEEFFRAKYYLMVIPTLVLWVMAIPYVFFGTKILLVNTAMMLYNIGVNGPLLLFLASYNRKRMELDRGQMMNYQGVGLNNFINVLPILLGPALLFLLFQTVSGFAGALIALSLMGLTGLLLHRWLVASAARFFRKNRYKIAEGYRST